jgi:hypothetical protein
VPKIISRYIADKTFKNFLENKMGGTFRKKKPDSIIELARKSREEDTISYKFKKILPKCFARFCSKSPDPFGDPFSDLNKGSPFKRRKSFVEKKNFMRTIQRDACNL